MAAQEGHFIRQWKEGIDDEAAAACEVFLCVFLQKKNRKKTQATGKAIKMPWK